VAALYKYLNLPVVPIALNSGLFWPRRTFRRYKGTIQVSILPPIQPGLSRKDFVKKLEDDIEGEMKNLI
jgi:1-acyl-sn-glycerol-3-phosphate acyltransferase